MENKIEILKIGTGIVVGLGIESVIANVVKSNTPEDSKWFNKPCTWIAVLVLTGMIGEKACRYTDAKIDDLVEYINTTMVKVKEELK